MKVIVLGASGQIGRVIYSELRNSVNMDVIGTSRKDVNGLVRFEPYLDDWALLQKADILINCVGQINESPALSFEKIHCGLTELILKNSNSIGNPRIIQISALGASSNHEVRFLKTKGIADELLLKAEHATVVRPSIVCTPDTMLVKKMRMLFRLSKFTGGLLFLPKGFSAHAVQPVMDSDLACIVKHLCISKELPKILNVTGDQPISFRELITMMFTTRKRPFKIVEIPKGITDILVKNIIGRLFPEIISDQQYKLLFEDNVANKSVGEYYLGRSMSSTLRFWENQFKQ